MSSTQHEDQLIDVRNNIGFLRLLFACMVVVGHSSELAYGNRSHEPLMRLFGTVSLGSVAVDGFFLISGYLITQSFQRSPSAGRYLWHRALRIYPGFLVAFLVSLLIGAMAGGNLASALSPTLAARALTLNPPWLDGAFTNLPIPVLNGSLWTIAYEFRCYILVLILGMLGVLRRRSWVAIAAFLLLILTVLPKPFETPAGLVPLVGTIQEGVRLTAMFLVGAVFCLYAVPLRANAAACSVVVAVGLLFTPLAEAGLAVFGGYALFWLGLQFKSGALSRINGKDDISYGVYLYAFPLTNLLIYWRRDISWGAVAAIVWAASIVAGWVSWKVVEQPAQRLKRWTPS